jgi:phosphatidylinositol alpha-mannosyltransferase
VDVLITHPYVIQEVRRGAERHLDDLVGYLRTHGHHVGVLTTTGDRNAPSSRPSYDGYTFQKRTLADWLTRRGVDPLVAFAPAMAWPLLRSRAPMVHALTHGAGLASVLTRRPGQAVVATLMGIPYRSFTEQSRSSKVAWRVMIERADEIICPSTFVAEVLEEEYGRPAPVISLGVDTNRFRPMGERGDPPMILFAGAFDEPRKGFALLMRAFRSLGEARGDVRILATGHGAPAAAHRLRNELPSGLRDRVEVQNLGAEELLRAYSSASVTVLPSRHEALGLTLIESLAAGTPVVGTDECGIVDVIDDDSIGRRFAPDDADDLARALHETLELAEDPSARDRCRGSATRFDWETVVGPAVEAVYARVAPS